MNVVDRLVMNLPHLLGNYEKYSKAEEIMGEKVPPNDPPISSGQFFANLRVPHNAQ